MSNSRRGRLLRRLKAYRRHLRFERGKLEQKGHTELVISYTSNIELVNEAIYEIEFMKEKISELVTKGEG